MRVHRRRRLLFAAVAALLAMRIFAGDARADTVPGPGWPEPGTTTEPSAVVVEPNRSNRHEGATFAVGAIAGALVVMALLGGVALLRRRRGMARDSHPADTTAEDGRPKGGRNLLVQNAPFALFGVGVVLLAGTVVAWWSVRVERDSAEVDSGSGTVPPPNDDSGAPTQPSPLPPPSPEPLHPPHRTAPPNSAEVEGADLHRVDVLDFFRQAKALARSMDAAAVLESARIEDACEGAINVLGPPVSAARALFSSADPSRTIAVDLEGRRLVAKWSTQGYARPAGVPQCHSAQIWAAAVREGAPSWRPAKMVYEGDGWLILPNGAPPLMVDARTCARRNLHPSLKTPSAPTRPGVQPNAVVDPFARPRPSQPR